MSPEQSVSPEQVPVPSRRSPQQRRSRATVANILDAADRILAAEGYDAISTTRVAAESGVAVGSLYRFFADKEAILDAVGVRYMDRVEELFRDVALRPVEDIHATVGQTIDELVSLLRETPAYRALWAGRRLSREMRLLDQAANDALAEILGPALADVIGLPRDEAVLVGRVCVETADALLQVAFGREPDGDPAIIAEAKSVLTGYLLVRASGPSA